jgi:type IV secretory pathway VirB10-like protein
MNKKLLATMIAATLSYGVASAQTTTPDDPMAAKPAVPSQEAKDAKVHSKAEYKARKKIADANKDLNKADCETSSDGMAEHACKKEARATAKQEKAAAQVIHENEKKEIKEGTKP